MADENQNRLIASINYSKSIAKETLVYKRDSWDKIEHFSMLFMFIASLGLFMYISIDSFLRSDFSTGTISLLPAIWIGVSAVFMNKMVKVEGKSILRNKEDVMNTLKYFYDDVTFGASEEDIIRDISTSGWFNSGRVITVLLNNNMVYFHKISLGRGGAMLPFYGPFDYTKAQEMAEHFKDIQATQPETI